MARRSRGKVARDYHGEADVTKVAIRDQISFLGMMLSNSSGRQV
jgi:hypothetical protein